MIIITIFQIVFAILFIGLVLLQAQGTGLGSLGAGGGAHYHTRRGAEKLIFGFTIFAASAFVVVSILSLVIK